MTIGPAPMIRIEEMSLRLGIESRVRTQKKGALSHVLRSRARFRFGRDRSMALPRNPGARALSRPESQGREGRTPAAGNANETEAATSGCPLGGTPLPRLNAHGQFTH